MNSALNQIALHSGYENHNNVPWQEITTAHIDAIVNHFLEKKHLSPTTVNLYLTALKGTMKHAWKAGGINYADYQRIAAIKSVAGKRIKRNKRNVIRHEVLVLIDYCERELTKAGVRNAAIFALLAGCGLRRDELVRLQLNDYNQTESILYVHGKGSKEREVIIPPVVESKLQAWLAMRGQDDGAIFIKITKHDTLSKYCETLTGQAIYNLLVKYTQLAQITHINPHALRHYFGTAILRSGTDIITVRDMLGHTSVSTTQTYIAEDKSEQRKAAKVVDV